MLLPVLEMESVVDLSFSCIIKFDVILVQIRGIKFSLQLEANEER